MKFFFLVDQANKLVLNPIPFSKQRKTNHGGVRREKVRLGKTFLLSFISNWTLFFQKFQINLRGLRLLKIKPYNFFRIELNCYDFKIFKIRFETSETIFKFNYNHLQLQ